MALGVSWGALSAALLLAWAAPPEARSPCPRQCTCYVPSEVHCTFRSLTRVPPSISPLVERINLGYNSIQALSNTSFSGLRKLELLMLHGNNIASLPDRALQELSSLQVLKLSYNGLRELGAHALQGLWALTRLHLDHNRLEWLHPRALHGLMGLRLLSLEGNHLAHLHPETFCALGPPAAPALSGLRHLQLAGNRLSRLGARSLATLPMLEGLHLHGNPWACDCRLQPLASLAALKQGVIKCKKDKAAKLCPLCSSPTHLQNAELNQLISLACRRPLILTKAGPNATLGGHQDVGDDHEDQDAEGRPPEWAQLAPTGHQIFLNLSDDRGGLLDFWCRVLGPPSIHPTRLDPTESGGALLDAGVAWQLECPLSGDSYQSLWKLLAYYSETPARLELDAEGNIRGSDTSHQWYHQMPDEASVYFTGLWARLDARPRWLLRPSIQLQMDRRLSTDDQARLTLTVYHSGPVSAKEVQEGRSSAWVLLRPPPDDQAWQVVPEGAQFELGCQADASQQPELAWQLPDGSKLQIPGRAQRGRLTATPGGQLRVREARQTDSGLYCCVAAVPGDKDSISYRILVHSRQGPPGIGWESSVWVSPGEAVTLPCPAVASPDARLSWALPDGQLVDQTTDDSDAKMADDGSLALVSVTPEQAGRYTCLALNPLGADRYSVELTVGPENPRGNGYHSSQPLPRKIVRGDKLQEQDGGSGAMQGNGESLSRRFSRPKAEEEEEEAVLDAPARQSTRSPASTVPHRQPLNVSGAAEGRRGFESRRRLHAVRRPISPQRWADILARVRGKKGPTVTSPPPPLSPSTPPDSEGSAEREISEGMGDPFPMAPNLERAFGIVPTWDVLSVHPSTAPDAVSLLDGFLPEPETISHHDRDTLERHLSTLSPVWDPVDITPVQGDPEGPHEQDSTLAATMTEDGIMSTTLRDSLLTAEAVSPRQRPRGGKKKNKKQKKRQRHGPRLSLSLPSLSLPSLLSLFPLGPMPGPTTIPSHETTLSTMVMVATMVPSGVPGNPPPGHSTYNLPGATTHPPGSDPATRSLEPSTPETDMTNVLASSGDPTVSPTVVWGHKTGDSGPVPTVKIVASMVPPLSRARTHDFRPISATKMTPVLSTSGARTYDFGPVPTTDMSPIPPSSGARTRSFEPIPATKMSPVPPTSGARTCDFGSIPATNMPPVPSSSGARTSGLGSRPARKTPPVPSISRARTHDFGPISSTKMPPVPLSSGVRTGDFGAIAATKMLLVPQASGARTYNFGPIPGIEMSPIPSISGVRTLDFKPTPATKMPLTPPSVGAKTHNFGLIPATRMVPIPPSSGARTHDFGPIPTTRSTTVPSSPWPKTGSLGHVVSMPPTESAVASLSLTAVTGIPEPSPRSPHDAWGGQPSQMGQGTSSIPSPGAIPRVRVPAPTMGRVNLGPYKRVDSQGVIHVELGPPAPPQGKPYSSSPPDSRYIPPTMPVMPSTAARPSGSFQHGPYRFFWPPGVKPRILTEFPPALTVMADEDVLLPCEASGRPVPFVTWTKMATGAVLTPSSRTSRFQVLRSGGLLLRAAQPQDSGRYVCSAHNLHGADRKAVALTISQRPPRLSATLPEEVTVPPGGTVWLDCHAWGSPDPQVTWVLPDGRAWHQRAPREGRVSLHANGTLTIRDTRLEDAGEYRCVAANRAGLDSTSVRLHVPAHVPVFLQDQAEEVSLPTGPSIYLHCSVRASPPASLWWTVPGGTQLRPSQALGARLMVFPNGTLLIRQLEPGDGGRFECWAVNPLGTVLRTVHLDVRTEVGSLGEPDAWVRVGDSLRLNCRHAMGTREPEEGAPVVWRLPYGQELDVHFSPDPRAQVLSNGTLVLNGVTERDAGEYLCRLGPGGRPAERRVLRVGPGTRAGPLVGSGMPGIMQGGTGAQAGSPVTPHPPLDSQVSSHIHISSPVSPHSPVSIGVGAQGQEAPARVLPMPPVPPLPAGSTLKLDCTSTGFPMPDVSWVLPNGRRVGPRGHPNDAFQGPRVLPNGTLHLPDMGLSQAGRYTCEARNRAGSDRSTVHIRVLSTQPALPDTFSEVEVDYGGQVTLHCLNPGTQLAPRASWLSPAHRPIMEDSDKYHLAPDGSLHIRGAQRADSGIYTCRPHPGEAPRTIWLRVRVRQPQINGHPGPETFTQEVAHVGEVKRLQCNAQGVPPPRVLWVLHRGVVLPAPYMGTRLTVHPDGTLEIRNVKKSDSAHLACVARSPAGEARLSILLSILGPQPGHREKVTALAGHTISLDCLAQAASKPPLTWILPNGIQLPEDHHSGRHWHGPDGRLHISSLAPSDAGVYRCQAGPGEWEVTLKVNSTPKVLPILSIVPGEALHLPCMLPEGAERTVNGTESTKPSRLSWTLPGGLTLEAPVTQGRVRVMEDGSLVLSTTTVLDGGTYVCRLGTGAGAAELHQPVVVLGLAPRAPNPLAPVVHARLGHPLRLPCPGAGGVPRPEVSWVLPNGRRVGPRPQRELSLEVVGQGDAGAYRCLVGNVLGVQVWTIYVQVH